MNNKMVMKGGEVVSSDKIQTLVTSSRGDRDVGTATLTIEQARQVSSGHIDTANDGTGDRKRKCRGSVLLNTLQRVNMCFLVLLVTYFVWSLSTNHGYGYDNSGDLGENHSRLTNSSHETDGLFDIRSLDEYIPKLISPEENQTDPPNHRRFASPHHRKQSKKRRRKERNRKRRQRLKNKHKSLNDIESDKNLTGSRRKNRRVNSTCSDCKIRKRKGRKVFNGKMSPHIFRKILEKVADDTLSGARSGEGTITSILEESGHVTRNKNRRKQKQSEWAEWNYDHNWVNLANNDALLTGDNSYEPDNTGSDDYVSPWTRWSSCSVSCGAGQQERTRQCGTACSEVESMVCLKPSCPDGLVDEQSTNTITEFYKWENKGFVPPLKLPQEQELDHTIDVCKNWVKCNKKFAQNYVSNASLPGCPCFYPLLRVKTKAIYDVNLDKDVRWLDISSHSNLVYKPGAKACIRSLLVKGTKTLSVQQCCYDNSHMLVTRGSAAGTPLLISPEVSKELHYKVDLLPWIICKGDWSSYQAVLVPNNQYQCIENPEGNMYEWQKNQIGNY